MTAAAGKGRRRALVTGGAAGIGAAITRALMRDGVECTITGRSKTRPAGLSHDVGYLSLDYENASSVREAVSYVRDTLRPDILVNNAGVNNKAPIEEVSADDLAVIVETNLTGPYRLTQACLPCMADRSWGRVVNISSIWSIVGNAGNSAYCAAKFGIDGFTASLAAEVAHKGILVNAIAPGYIATEKLLEKYSSEDIETIARHIPVGRLGKPEEIAEVAAFLASDRNSYISGQNICVDGGLTRTSQPLRRY